MSSINRIIPKLALRACSETSIGFASGYRDMSVRIPKTPINTNAGSICAI